MLVFKEKSVFHNSLLDLSSGNHECQLSRYWAIFLNVYIFFETRFALFFRSSSFTFISLCLKAASTTGRRSVFVPHQTLIWEALRSSSVSAESSPVCSLVTSLINHRLSLTYCEKFPDKVKFSSILIPVHTHKLLAGPTKMGPALLSFTQIFTQPGECVTVTDRDVLTLRM